MSARGSTLAHMHQMLATATAVATASSCSRPDLQQTVTLTPLPTVPASIDTTPVPRPPAPTANATFTAQPPSPPDTAGYLVVDMLPAPARCLGIAPNAKSSGKFRRDAGTLVIDLVVTLTTSGATFTGAAATAWSAQVVSTHILNNSTVASVRVQPTGANLGVSLAVSCPQGTGTLAVDVSYTGTAAEGTPVSLALHDY
jgi:hypothetical protein